MTEAPDRFETVAYVYSQPELSILLSLLEDEGVEPQCIGRLHAAVRWDWAIALGGTQLRVHHSQAARVRARLAAIDQGRPWRGGVFTDIRILDIALAIAIFLWCAIPPPCRLPTEFVPATTRREAAT